MKTIPATLIALALCAPTSAPFAQTEAAFDPDQVAELLAVKVRTVRHMALNPVLVRAVRAQNAEGLGEDTISARDEAWQAEDGLTQFKWELQENPAGRFLRAEVERSTTFNEAFLTDGAGANVAAYPPTSDYFQGDEEKWSESFNRGAGKVFIGPLELDESTQVYAVQISAPVLDRGRTIGVLVVGVTVDYLEAKRALEGS